MTDQTADLRNQVQALRKALSKEDVRSRSDAVCSRFLGLIPKELPILAEKSLTGKKIGLYRSLPEELSLTVLEDHFSKAGAELFFPRVIKAGGRPKDLEFAAIPKGKQPSDFLEVGAFGILEPERDLPAAPLEGLDVIFVPGVVYGSCGTRAGRGAGFYDRILPGVSAHCLKIALIFDFQLVPQLEPREWDQPVDWIFAESFHHHPAGKK